MFVTGLLQLCGRPMTSLYSDPISLWHACLTCLLQACHRHGMDYTTHACERLVCAILLLYLARPVTGLLIIFA